MTPNSGKLGVSLVLSLMLSAAGARAKASPSDITIETVQVTATREHLREASAEVASDENAFLVAVYRARMGLTR